MTKTGAIYVRLSRDDGNTNIESESIANQKLFLRQYAAQHGIKIGGIFCDDGISGTEWERPGLQSMLFAIQSGRIDLVLVKDLSRLSRDYIRTGELLERIFPVHGVRLISVSDGIDTGSASLSNDYSPIRAVMDDWYARDISRKVRAAIYARQKAGFCTAARLPFGFIREGEEILLHTKAAEIVRMMFSEYLSCNSCAVLCRMLNAGGYPSPGAGRWNDRTVHRILKNPAYVGKLHLHRSEKCSYKSNLRFYLPESEAVIIQIPPIVSENTFQKVQYCLQSRMHRVSEHHWMSGIAFCGVCGAKMTVAHDGSVHRLICGGRKRGEDCQNPSVRLPELEQQLLQLLQTDGILIQQHDLHIFTERLVILPSVLHVYLRYSSSIH